MEDNSHPIATRNDLSLKRLFLYEEYFTLMDKVETSLAECRSNMGKTKKIVGFSFNTLGHLDDSREIVPSIWIELGDGEQASSTFAIGPSNREGESAAEGLRKRQQTSPDSDSKKPESSCPSSIFRPFGILEPQSAKVARQNMKSLLPLICDLANIRAQIRELDSKIGKMARVGKKASYSRVIL